MGWGPDGVPGVLFDSSLPRLKPPSPESLAVFPLQDLPLAKESCFVQSCALFWEQPICMTA